MDPNIDLLTGTVRVPAPAPATWLEEGLCDFYEDPNHERWGAELCRVLYHETLHFWQFLGWCHVATVIGDQWRRLEAYEETGEIPPPSKAGSDYPRAGEGAPFSALDLVECHARYWDVHTRGPDAIIADEALDVPDGVGLRRGGDYTSDAYDLVMCAATGSDYEQPYRWMLEKAEGNSKLVAVTFPLLMHVAFGGDHPVRSFREGFEHAVQDGRWRTFVAESAGSINYGWMDCWGAFRALVVGPVLGERSVESGLAQIEQGPLRSHPLFPEYIFRLRPMEARMDMHFAILQDTLPRSPADVDQAEKERITVISLPDKHGIGTLFGLPGIPDYRLVLGWFLAPPRIVFENFTLYVDRPKQRGVHPLQGLPPFMMEREEIQEVYVSLDQRVERFRQATYLQKVGLPPNALESVSAKP